MLSGKMHPCTDRSIIELQSCVLDLQKQINLLKVTLRELKTNINDATNIVRAELQQFREYYSSLPERTSKPFNPENYHPSNKPIYKDPTIP